MASGIAWLDSITMAGRAERGRVAVCGSHGGFYCGALAARAGLRAVILNDAGIGRDRAGVAGVMALDSVGMAAAAVDGASCRIGNARDMARGTLSCVNATAAASGLVSGMGLDEATARLETAPRPAGTLETPPETRAEIALGPARLVLVDSGSLAGPQDEGAMLVTGSHGGEIGAPPHAALPCRPALAAFNDAGLGAEDWGASRLPGLAAQGIPAVVVSHWSARIGSARSSWEDGIVSRANAVALALGILPGSPLKGISRLSHVLSGR